MTINTTRITTPADAACARAKAHRKRAYAADLEPRDRLGARVPMRIQPGETR